MIENQNDDLKPKILTKLKDVYSESNNKATFMCEFSSLYESKISWYHNEKAIKQSSNEIKYLFNNELNKSTMTVLNVELEDSGFYEFRIQNKFGANSTTAKLIVNQGNNLKIK